MKKLILRFFVVFVLFCGFFGGQSSAQIRISEQVASLKKNIHFMRFFKTALGIMNDRITYLRKPKGIIFTSKDCEAAYFLLRLRSEMRKELLGTASPREAIHPLEPLQEATRALVDECVLEYHLVKVEGFFASLKSKIILVVQNVIDEMKKVALKTLQDRFSGEDRFASFVFMDHKGKELPKIYWYLGRYKRALDRTMKELKKLRACLEMTETNGQGGCIFKNHPFLVEVLNKKITYEYGRMLYYLVADYECRCSLEEKYRELLRREQGLSDRGERRRFITLKEIEEKVRRLDPQGCFLQ